MIEMYIKYLEDQGVKDVSMISDVNSVDFL